MFVSAPVSPTFLCPTHTTVRSAVSEQAVAAQEVGGSGAAPPVRGEEASWEVAAEE